MALSFENTGKYTSERHQLAIESGKLTAGEVVKFFPKKSITAKKLVEAFIALKGYEPEWHHAGFYQGSKGSTMGRTFFFTVEQKDELLNLGAEKLLSLIETKNNKTVEGFYYEWVSLPTGKKGKQLKRYNGLASKAPKNFTAFDESIAADCDECWNRPAGTHWANFLAAVEAGKIYTGFNQPEKFDFKGEVIK